MPDSRPIFVVCGIGNGTGTGGHAARVFSKAGYDVALISRDAGHLDRLANEISGYGGHAKGFPVSAYQYKEIHFAFAAIKEYWPDREIRAGLFNATRGVWKPFLEVTEQEIQACADAEVVGAFSFARECILAFKDLPLNDYDKRGFLMFTGSTGAIRGNIVNSVPSAGKFALRSLSQSLAKEFGKQGIHVSFAIIDGRILTEVWKDRLGEEKYAELAESVNTRLNPESIAKAYLYLSQQDSSAWTWELDMRPSHERW